MDLSVGTLAPPAVVDNLIAPEVGESAKDDYQADPVGTPSTDDEAEAALGMSHQTVSSARNRLEKAGLVVKAYTDKGTRAKRRTRSYRPAGVYVSAKFDTAPPRPVIDPDAQALADTLTAVGNQFGIISREMLGDVPGGHCADSVEVLGLVWPEVLEQITKATKAFDQYKAAMEYRIATRGGE